MMMLRKSLFAILLSMCSVVVWAAPGDEYWEGMGGFPGANGNVYAVVQHGSDIYVGGSFTVIGDVIASGVAKWDGSKWSALGAGIPVSSSNGVRALALDANGNLYAGGRFTSPGNSIAMWDGAQWRGLGAGVKNCLTGSCSASVDALSVDSQNNLYAGGNFIYAGDSAVNYIAIWNGSTWSSLGNGVGSTVSGIAIDNNDNAYVVGGFSIAGGISASKIAKWDGSTWSALGSGVPSYSSAGALAVDSYNNVYIGGYFSTIGGVTAKNIAKWNGVNWAALGGGFQSTVNSITLDSSGKLYVGGGHSTSGDIAFWSGSNWVNITTGMNNSIHKMAFDLNDSLYVGGEFTSVSNNSVSKFAKWSNDAWQSVGSGFDVEIKKLIKNSFGDIYAIQENKISKWSGFGWQAVASDVGILNTAVTDIDESLYVAGQFNVIGGIEANSVAKWDGLTWLPLGGGLIGGTPRVLALATDGFGNIYAGGMFQSAEGVTNTSYLAKWNGSSWEALGSGVNDKVTALEIDSDGNLYAVGSFTTAGGITANGIAKWDGINWHAFGNGFPQGSITAITIDSFGNIYVGGDLGWLAGVRTYIAKWDGSGWVPLNGSGVGYQVYALATDSTGALYVGGYFNGVRGIVKWNGSAWRSLGDGVRCYSTSGGVCTGRVNTLLADSVFDVLYVGGKFDSAGGRVGSFIAKWLIVDSDGDNWQDYEDAFPNDPAKWLDTDNDGIDDNSDNCPSVANTNQSDMDSDTIGDVCDPDIDGDGVSNSSDDFPLNPLESKDTDGDGLGDNADLDIDGDGVDNISDAFPFNQCARNDTDGDGMPNDIYCKSGDDFETGDLNQLPWQTSGAAWDISAYHVYQGAYSAFTDASFWGQQSILSLTVATGPEISFQFDIDELNCSSSGIDFYIDGVLYANWNDLFCQGFAWTLVTVSLTPGVHEFSWLYTSWDDPGNSKAYLDNVSFGSDLVKDTDDDNDSVADIADRYPLDNTRYQNPRHNTDTDMDSDLLTRSASLGTWTRHTVQNAAITGTGSMNAYTSSSVQYVAQLDANGDGDADILTRNTLTGAWYLHQVQSGAVTSTAPIYLYANLDQQFIGAGDFNNDGTDDVMLRSASSGYFTVFLLQNHAVNSSVFYNAWTASSSVPQGIGDFDGDGTDDLLVRRTSDNLYFIFKTTNGGVANVTCACNLWANPDWTFQFAGDTNKDGTDDIVIRGTGASADGKWWNFRMSNFSSAETTNLNTFLNKTQVSFAASGDYNADGHTDMLIRVNNGPVYVARIVNGVVSGSTLLLTSLPADQVVLK